jgi:hypothetical protein
MRENIPLLSAADAAVAAHHHLSSFVSMEGFVTETSIPTAST